MHFNLLISIVIVCDVISKPVQCSYEPQMITGEVIVHLFEWKWSDVAKECEVYLAQKRFGGVQVSPPNEYVVALTDQFQRPWWERYQPVSYQLISRSGDGEQFRQMVERCNAVGVRIYVDTVINHMTGGWPEGTKGVGGGSFNSTEEIYPAVGYSDADFNDRRCYTASGNIEDYDDAEQVRNCKLVGLNDLNQKSDHVRNQIVDYMNSLIDMGVAGFRVDASKHMWPEDLGNIYRSLKDLNETYFEKGSKPFIYQEVIDRGGEPITAAQYTSIGRVTEFKYGMYLSSSFRGNDQLKWLAEFGEKWGLINQSRAVVFIDNHDNQRTDSQILTFRDTKIYKMAVAFMLAYTYGLPRIMSSYFWERNWVDGIDLNSWMGPPHDHNFNITSPTFDGDICTNGWICEHRWREIANMVTFRSVVKGTNTTNWWDNGSNQISFCRGDRGFIAVNNDPYDLVENLQTCLPAGVYCDIISGQIEGGSCTGKEVIVSTGGLAEIIIRLTDIDGVMAIHLESAIPDNSANFSTKSETEIPSEADYDNSTNSILKTSTAKSGPKNNVNGTDRKIMIQTDRFNMKLAGNQFLMNSTEIDSSHFTGSPILNHSVKQHMNKHLNLDGTYNVNHSDINNVNPGGRNRVNPSGRQYVNPSGRLIVNPSSRLNVNPRGRQYVNPSSRNNVNPSGRHNVNPSGSQNVNPSGSQNVNPSGRHTVNNSGRHNVNPTVRHDMNLTDKPFLFSFYSYISNPNARHYELQSSSSRLHYNVTP